MKFVGKFFFTILLSINFLSFAVLNHEKKVELARIIDHLIKSTDPHVQIGIEIVSLKDYDCWYTQNAHHLFVPASTLKLFTATAALYLLGFDYRFQTKLYKDDQNIYLQCSGDPSFGSRDLQWLVQQLKEQGIQKISGSCIVDDTEFDGVSRGPGWMWDDGSYFWSSPLSACVVQHNCVAVTVQSDQEQVQASLRPQTSYMTIVNKARLATQTDTKPLLIQRRAQENVIDISGTLAPDSQPQTYYIPVKQPMGYICALMKDLLQAEGIVCHTGCKQGTVAPGAQLVATHESAPLTHLVARMLKESDNLYADAFLKKVGTLIAGKPGTWQQGAQAIKEFLRTKSLHVERLELYDGSGRSRYNLTTPHQLMELLLWQSKQPEFRLFLSMLSVTGVDGTLKERMSGIRVRAKTGSMKGVSGLAGYLLTRSSEPVAFAILMNNFVGSASKYKALEDKICTYLSQIF